MFEQNKEERYLYTFAPVATRYVRLTYPDRYEQQARFPNTYAFTTEVEAYAPAK